MSSAPKLPRLSDRNRFPVATRLGFDQVIAALAEDGLVSDDDVKRARQAVREQRAGVDIHPLVLVANLKFRNRKHPASELNLETLSNWLAQQCGVRYLRIDPMKVDVPAVTALISHAYAQRHRILPVAVNAERVVIATSEPTDLRWQPDLAQILRREIIVVVTNPLDLARYTMEFFGVTRSVRGAKDSREENPTVSMPSFEQLVELGRAGEVGADDRHIVHIVDWLLQYAYEQRASDIHLEPRRDISRVRFRIDGVLHKVFELPTPVMIAAISRIKVLGRMDLGERRRPQDGRIKTRSPGGREVEMRLSTMPTAFGEKCVMRIFDPDTAVKSTEELGFDNHEAEHWKELTSRPHGIVLVTGPTGSGKTTTLYTALSQLNTPDVKIITVEDPVEYQLEGVNQIQAKPQIGLDFSHALRSIVRQDPDIIMIGEMRDLETAKIAIQSALTGHLVLSTLHTNNAAGGVTRLLDMGVEDYLLTSTVNGILAQRLVRRLEPTHAERYEPSPEVIEEFDLRKFQPEGTIYLYRPVPSALTPTGYLGRTTIMEFLVVTEPIRRLVMKHADTNLIEEEARRLGMRTMYEDGLVKAMQGVTTIEEVLRVTQEN